MSHPPGGLFGEKVDYSTAHISGQSQNGNVFDWEGEKIQYRWDDESIVHTSINRDGVVHRNVYIGEFDFDGNTLYTSSRLKYRADFHITPSITTGGEYLGNGTYESTPRQTHTNVESGYLIQYDRNVPYPLGSENEHCQLKWRYAEVEDARYLYYSDSGEFCGNWVEGTTRITDRQVLENSPAGKYFPEGWWKDPFKTTISESDNDKNQTDEHEGEDIQISAPRKYKVKAIDKITNFSPSTDTLEIDTDSFGIDSSATFASGQNKKKVKKKLAKQDFDFLYDEKKGGLYFNENGADKGFGDGGIIAILKGAPELTASNLEFI